MTTRFLILFLSLNFLIGELTAQDTVTIDYEQPKEMEIGGIRVEGAGGISEQLIISRSGLFVGAQITVPGEEISEAIRKLWQTGLFSDVKIYIEREYEGDLVFLRIKVKERPRLAKYQILGVKKSAQDDINERIKISRGSPVTEYEKSRITNTITKYYSEKGYRNAKIDLIEKADTAQANAVILIIDIERGQKVRIASIDFEGNKAVNDRKLRSVMKETKEKTQFNLTPKNIFRAGEQDEEVKGMGFFEILGNISFNNVMNYLDDKITLQIFSSSKFLENEFEDDKNAIIDYYNSQGYRNAVIIADSVYDIDEANIGIKIRVNEDQKYYFRKIVFEGNTKYSDELLGQVINIKKGDVYNTQRLEQKLFFDPNGTDVSSLYMDDGFLFFQVTPEEVAVVGDSIDVLISIYEGARATIDEVLISGNTKTNENVIRRELRTLPGEKFSRSDLIRSQREIAALGYFDPEQIGINPIPSPEDGTVDIEYSVVEKPSDQVELSAGWGGPLGGIYGSAGIVFNNFSLRNAVDPSTWHQGFPAGDGQSISFRLQSRGKYLQNYTFSFSEPWLGGKKPISLSTSLNYTLYNPSYVDKDDPDVKFLITRGGTVSLGKRLKWPDNYFQGNLSLTYQNYFLRNFDEFLIKNGYANNLSLKGTVARMSAGNNPHFPTYGSNVTLSLQMTPPYSLLSDDIDLEGKNRYKWIEFHKWRFNAEWFTALTGQGREEPGIKKLVLKTAANFGFLGYYNQELGISPFERFRVGGDGLSGGFTLYGYDIISLRGTENTFFPVGTPSQLTSGSGSDAYKNAPIFNKFSVELRYPFSLNPSSTIYALAFLEGGNSYYNFDNYNPFNLKKSAGLGLRLYLPMFGLLGFDYGILLDNESLSGKSFGEIMSNGAFHFKLGFEPE